MSTELCQLRTMSHVLRKSEGRLGHSEVSQDGTGASNNRRGRTAIAERKAERTLEEMTDDSKYRSEQEEVP